MLRRLQLHPGHDAYNCTRVAIVAIARVLPPLQLHPRGMLAVAPGVRCFESRVGVTTLAVACEGAGVRLIGKSSKNTPKNWLRVRAGVHNEKLRI